MVAGASGGTSYINNHKQFTIKYKLSRRFIRMQMYNIQLPFRRWYTLGDFLLVMVKSLYMYIIYIHISIDIIYIYIQLHLYLDIFKGKCFHIGFLYIYYIYISKPTAHGYTSSNRDRRKHYIVKFAFISLLQYIYLY